MTLADAEPINIKDLVLDEPQKTRELFFDLDRDLTPDIKQKLTHEMANLLKVDLATKLIWGNNLITLTASTDEQDRSSYSGLKDKAARTIRDLAESDRQNHWVSFVNQGAAFRALFPTEPFPVELSDEIFSSITEEFLDIRPSNTRISSSFAVRYAEGLRDCLILWPQKHSQLMIPPRAERMLREQVLKSELKFPHWEGSLDEFSVYAISCILMALKLFTKQKEQLTAQDYQQLIRSLNAENNTIRASSLIFNLLALQADQVKVTNKGVEFINFAQPLEDPQGVPEVRSF